MEEGSLIPAVYERINCDKCKLESKELEAIEVDSFNLSDFWSQFGAAVQSLSSEVTKVGFMCGKRPFPKRDELNGMLGDLMQHYSLMRDLFLVLPEEVGATVYNAVTGAVLSIMTALLAVITSLSDMSEKGAKERLTLISTLWDACNAVESLPRNNLTATLKALDEETALATDAQEELITKMVACLESLNNTPERPNPNSPSQMRGRPSVFQLSPSFGRVQNLQTVQMVLPPPQSTSQCPSVMRKSFFNLSLEDVLSNISKHNSSLPVDAWIVQSKRSDVFHNIYVSLRMNEDSLSILERLNYKVVVFPRSNYYAYFKKPRGGSAGTDEWLPPKLVLDYERTCQSLRRHNRGHRPHCTNCTRYHPLNN